MTKSIIERIAEWQRDNPAFKHVTTASTLKHLAAEYVELYDAIATLHPREGNEAVAEEVADLVFFAIQLSWIVGFDLEEALELKLAENILRNWFKPSEDGVVMHVRDDEDKDKDAVGG